MRILVTGMERLLPASGYEGEGMRSMASKLVERGHDVTVLAPMSLGEEEIRRVELGHNIRLLKLPLREERQGPSGSALRDIAYCITSGMSLARLLRRERYDVVFAANCPLLIPPAILRMFSRSMFVLNIVDFVASQSCAADGRPTMLGGAFYRLEKALSRSFDLVFASTPQMKMLLVGGGTTPSRIHVTYTGVDNVRFGAECVDEKDVSWIRMEAGIERRSILFRGTLDKHAAEMLEKIVRLVSEKRDDVTFIISGDGPCYYGLKQNLQSEFVKFVGVIPPELAPAYVKAANASLIMARKSFNSEFTVPIELLESLAMGVPVATTHSRSVSELFSVYDFVKVSDSAEELASHVVELADRSSSDEPVNLVRERFGWQAVTTNMAELIELKFSKTR